MGFVDFFKNAFGTKGLDSTVPGSYPGGAFSSDITSSSGQIINYWRALQQATVLQCVTVLSNGVSQVPFRLMREGNTHAKENPLYYLFREKPNRWQSSYEFWNMVMFHLALQGEIVIWKIRVRGVLQELIPFPPDSFTIDIEYKGGWAVKTYRLRKDDSSEVAVPETDVWHLRWREYGVRLGLPQIQVAKDVVGNALAGDIYTGTAMKNGSTLSGILNARQQMNPEQRMLLQNEWEKSYGGVLNAHKTVVIGADLEYRPISQTNQAAQFIEQRKLQIEEICRCWNVNPLMVFYFDNTASYGNSEQMMIQHVVHTMSPWYRMIEESAYVNLLTEDERRREGLYFAFNDNALLRADSQGRSEFYHKLFNIGAITPNEIRSLEDMPPKEGGDKLYVQGAIVPLEDAGKWNNEGSASTPSEPSEEDKPEDENA